MTLTGLKFQIRDFMDNYPVASFSIAITASFLVGLIAGAVVF